MTKNLKIMDFNCCNGFMDGFKERNGVEFEMFLTVPQDISVGTTY